MADLARLTRAMELMDRLSLDEAVCIMTEGILDDPKNARSVLELGMVLISARRPEEAIKVIGKAAEMDPNNASVYGYLGQAHYFGLDYEKAEEFFQKALQIDPEDVPALHGLGMLEIDCRKYYSAEQVFSKIITKHGPVPPILCERGYARIKMGRVDDAIGDYTAALAVQPNNVVALESRANAYKSIGKYDLALQDLNTLASFANGAALLEHIKKPGK